MSVKENICRIVNAISDTVTLVAVSKTKPIELLQEAYECGQRVFGENKVQELVDKEELLPKDIEWHFIGHLQSNKVKYIAPFISLIHGVDSLKLLKVIDKEGKKNDRVIKCLLQVYIAQESTKFGMSQDEMEELLCSEDYQNMKNVQVIGLMGMATNTSDKEVVRKEFSLLKALFVKVKNHYFSNDDTFKELSMGMSGDYLIAIKEGSTMIRVGSGIFGERNYSR